MSNFNLFHVGESQSSSGGGAAGVDTDQYRVPLVVSAGNTVVEETWCHLPLTITQIEVRAATAPTTAGTYTLAITGAGNNLYLQLVKLHSVFCRSVLPGCPSGRRLQNSAPAGSGNRTYPVFP